MEQRCRVLRHHFNYESTDQFIHQFNCSYTHSFLMLHGTFHIRNPFKKRLISIWLRPRVCIYDPPLTPIGFLRAGTMYRQVLIEGHFTGLRWFLFRGRNLGDGNLRSKTLVKTPKFSTWWKPEKWGPEDFFFGERILFFGSILNLGSVNSRILEYKLVLLMFYHQQKHV